MKIITFVSVLVTYTAAQPREIGQNYVPGQQLGQGLSQADQQAIAGLPDLPGGQGGLPRWGGAGAGEMFREGGFQQLGQGLSQADQQAIAGLPDLPGGQGGLPRWGGAGAGEMFREGGFPGTELGSSFPGSGIGSSFAGTGVGSSFSGSGIGSSFAGTGVRSSFSGAPSFNTGSMGILPSDLHLLSQGQTSTMVEGGTFAGNIGQTGFNMERGQTNSVGALNTIAFDSRFPTGRSLPSFADPTLTGGSSGTPVFPSSSQNIIPQQVQPHKKAVPMKKPVPPKRTANFPKKNVMPKKNTIIPKLATTFKKRTIPKHYIINPSFKKWQYAKTPLKTSFNTLSNLNTKKGMLAHFYSKLLPTYKQKNVVLVPKKYVIVPAKKIYTNTKPSKGIGYYHSKSRKY